MLQFCNKHKVMTKKQIEELFEVVLHKRGAITSTGVDRVIAANWRTGRTVITFGNKLEVLYNLKLIEIHEPTTGKGK